MSLIFRNPTAAAYGTITVGALLAAESARAETYLKTTASLLITLVLYWLAYSYAEMVGDRLRSGGRLTAAQLLARMMHELPILVGAAIPLITVLVCWVAGTDLTDGLTSAVWTSAVVILLIELAAGVRARLSGVQLVVQALAGAGLGLLIIVLRGILH